ncbi:MAG TPA: M28 family peptidase [Jiangellaceae bacterium]
MAERARPEASRRTFLAWLAAGGLSLGGGMVIAGCSETDEPRSAVRVTGSPPSPAGKPAPPATVTLEEPPQFDGAVALEVIEHLAAEVGPREGTSRAFHRAAGWVAERFTELDYHVTEQDVPVPRGDASYRPEWGTVVEPGTSVNVIAEPAGFDPEQPHAVIGAHLDTVAVAPGAEDNASGVGAVLELAQLLAVWPADVPVRLIAFGAEEPRGSGDDMHHFGSQLFVRNLSEPEQAAVIGMVSLDRVGVRADAVPVGWGGRGPRAVVESLLDLADRTDIPAVQTDNRSSDHWSFEKAGIAAARLGSVPFGAYHSARDVPSVIDRRQIRRVGRLTHAWALSLRRP